MTSFPVVVVSSFALVGLVLLAAGWLIEMEPKGRHTAQAVAIRLQAETIEVVRTRNSPPPQFFSDDPHDWTGDYVTWSFDTSSIRALRALLAA